MRVLFISYDGMTDQLGQSQVLPYLTGLSKAGPQIHLLSFEKEQNFVKEESLIRDICAKSNIYWHPLSYTAKPPVLSSIYDYIRMRKYAWELHEKHRFNLIHCRSYLPAMTGAFIKKKSGVPFLFDMRGFWADERVEGRLWNRSNPIFNLIYNFFKKEEKKLFQNADGIVSLTQKAVPIIRTIQEGKSNAPLAVIPCCVDTLLFDPEHVSQETIAKTKMKLGLSTDDFVLCYLGGIGTWYLAEEMFDFFKRLLNKYPNAKFLFITKELPQTLKTIAVSKDIPVEKIIVQPATRKEIPTYLSIADASIYFIMNSFSKQASSPTKQGEVMSMGLPLICNVGVGDSSDIVSATNSGYVIHSFDIEEYDRVINELRYPISKEEKSQIRATAIQYFSLEDGVSSYIKMYQQFTKNDDKAHSLK